MTTMPFDTLSMSNGQKTTSNTLATKQDVARLELNNTRGQVLH